MAIMIDTMDPTDVGQPGTAPARHHRDLNSLNTYRHSGKSARKQSDMIEAWAKKSGPLHRLRDGTISGGVTIDEGIVFLSGHFNRDMQASPRFKFLEDQGRLVKTKHKRATRTGQPASIYVARVWAAGSELEFHKMWIDEAQTLPVDNPDAMMYVAVGGAAQPVVVPAPVKPALVVLQDTLAASGHGWVVARTDGVVADCRGPQYCGRCAIERSSWNDARAAAKINP